MPVSRYFAVVGSALLLFMLISDAYFGESEGASRFNGSFYQSATFAPRLAEPAAADERLFTLDATPASRIKDVFSRFGPNESRRDRRVSSIEPAIR